MLDESVEHRAEPKVLCPTFSGTSLELCFRQGKATSVTAAEFYDAVIPSDVHVSVNSAVVHS